MFREYLTRVRASPTNTVLDAAKHEWGATRCIAPSLFKKIVRNLCIISSNDSPVTNLVNTGNYLWWWKWCPWRVLIIKSRLGPSFSLLIWLTLVWEPLISWVRIPILHQPEAMDVTTSKVWGTKLTIGSLATMTIFCLPLTRRGGKRRWQYLHLKEKAAAVEEEHPLLSCSHSSWYSSILLPSRWLF